MNKTNNTGTLSPAVISESNGINSNKIDKTITSSKMKLSIKTKHYTRTCFTAQQVTELISKAYSKNPRLACLWHLGYLTGLRLRELLELEWSQVDLEKGVLGITEIIPNNSERSKYPYQWKLYPLHGELLAILEQMKREDESKSNYLFPAWQGEKRMVVSRLNRKLIDSIGLGNGSHPDYFYTFHSLRAAYFMRKRMADSSSESNLISNTAAKFSAANNSNSEL